MKSFQAVLLSAVLFLAHLHTIPALAATGYIRVSYLEGDAQIMTPETGEWSLLSINTPIGEGDQLWLPLNAIAELQLNGSTYIRLDGDTSLHILSMDEDAAQFYLARGSAYAYFDAREGGVVQIDTPDSSTRAFDRAIFRVDAPAEFTEISCYKGYVETENNAGSTRVNAGQRLSFRGQNSGELTALGPPDEWTMWNKARNEELFPPASPQGYYLPEELSSYSSELNRSGRWVQSPEYGYVWTPTLIIGVNWAPYRHGRWVWRHHDYIWLPDEPWGWAPYHYGRWAHSPAIGWFWVPPRRGAAYWGPGYVGWARTDDHVAWVPLAPGEVYYGRGHYGHDSVDITHVDIRRIEIKKIYRNTFIDNGPTIVSRDGFHRGVRPDDHRRQKEIRERIFDRRHLSPGTPDIKPGRESYVGGGRRVAKEKIPPAPVRKIAIKELQEERRLIRERNRSVFHQDAAPRPLPVVRGETGKAQDNKKHPGWREDVEAEHEQPYLPGGNRHKQQQRVEQAIEEKRQAPPKEKRGNGRVHSSEPQSEEAAPLLSPGDPGRQRQNRVEEAIEEKRRPQQRIEPPPDNRSNGKVKKREPGTEEETPIFSPRHHRSQPQEGVRQVIEEKRQARPDDNPGNNRQRAREQTEEERPRFSPDNDRGARREREQIRPEAAPTPVFDGGEATSRGKRGRQENDTDAAECGPGGRDEFNPAKCPGRRR